MPLTDTAIRRANPLAKPFRIADAAGLYLEVSPSGGKLWRFKYRFDRKQKLLALGIYPQISLASARQKRDEARKLLASGTDPGEQRKAAKAARDGLAANTFEVIGREWYAKISPSLADTTKDRVVGGRVARR
ncbi:MAG: Arm DNA-binding domain-containing protein, partial [Burkholderiales bacterium]